jgi:5-formyltetrahydrofolate cyclo-ligase
MSLRKGVWLRFGTRAAQAIAGKGVPLVQSFGPPGAAIGGYYPLHAELDPLPLLTAVHARGFCIALPRTGKRLALSFRGWTPGSALQQRKFGLQEPADTQPVLHPSIIFVPLVAFDRKGNRLGYGAGYYDACLRALRARQRVLAIGVAFDEQEVSEIPREPQDEPLDMILTPSRVIACKD